MALAGPLWWSWWIRYCHSSLSNRNNNSKSNWWCISFYNGKTIHTFTSLLVLLTPGSFSETVEYVVIVAGGGGGGGSSECWWWWWCWSHWIHTSHRTIYINIAVPLVLVVVALWANLGKWKWIRPLAFPAGTVTAGGGGGGGDLQSQMVDLSGSGGGSNEVVMVVPGGNWWWCSVQDHLVVEWMVQCHGGGSWRRWWRRCWWCWWKWT